MLDTILTSTTGESLTLANTLIIIGASIILGLIILASICCKIITTIAIARAFPNPPVIKVTNIPILTATIAPI